MIGNTGGGNQIQQQQQTITIPDPITGEPVQHLIQTVIDPLTGKSSQKITNLSTNTTSGMTSFISCHWTQTF